MEALAAALAGVEWGNHAASVWGFLRGQADSGVGFLLSLPTTCKLATIHAGYICMGQDPSYFAIPGFPPITLSWGWLLVGMIIGAASMLTFLVMTGRVYRPPSLLTMAQIAGAGDQALQARRDMVRYISSGRAALQDMAAAGGVSEMELLRRAYGIPLPAAQPAALPLQARDHARWM